MIRNLGSPWPRLLDAARFHYQANDRFYGILVWYCLANVDLYC